MTRTFNQALAAFAALAITTALLANATAVPVDTALMLSATA